MSISGAFDLPRQKMETVSNGKLQIAAHFILRLFVHGAKKVGTHFPGSATTPSKHDPQILQCQHNLVPAHKRGESIFTPAIPLGNLFN